MSPDQLLDVPADVPARKRASRLSIWGMSVEYFIVWVYSLASVHVTSAIAIGSVHREDGQPIVQALNAWVLAVSQHPPRGCEER